MTTMLSSWEMRTHGQAALRVVGLPFGASERAMQLLVWSHAVVGDGVEFLVEHEDDIRATATRSLAVVDETPGSVTIDANGQSLLSAGPAAIDLALAMAASTGQGRVVVGSTFGDRFAAELAHRGAARGVATSVSTSSAGWFGSADGRVWPTDARSDALVVDCGPEQEPGTDPIDVEARLAAADRHGYPTEPSAAARFFELGHQLWLPSSPRSRAQGSEGDQA